MTESSLGALAEEAAARLAADKAATADAAASPRAEAAGEAMDRLANSQRERPEKTDPLDPVVIRGANADTVNNFKTSTKDQLTKLGRRYESMKADAQGHSADIGNMLTKAEETQNLDKWCFKEAMKWKKMSADKKIRRLAIFMKYLDDLGVVEEATAQADLLAEVDRDEEQKQGDIEAVEAATSLAPARKPRMSVVPKEGEQPGEKLH